MARQLRTYFPGGFLHMTARTQGKAAWFDEPMRDGICERIATVQQRTDIRVVAFVIMPNHMHFVVQQRDSPLSRFMHPLLCNVAAMVKKKFATEGHVFERRFWDHPCMSQEYLMRCIQYVHYNPVKAALCTAECEYLWSSYQSYANGRQRTPVVVEPVVDIISSSSITRSLLPTINQPGFRPQRDLADLVDHTLRQFQPPIDIELLRNARGRNAAAVRRQCISYAAQAGYRNCQIARYLKVSESIVSRVVVGVRRNTVIRDAWLNAPKCEDEKHIRKK